MNNSKPEWLRALTQAEVAERMGTKTPDIAMLFDVPKLSLQSASLRELLNSAYSEFVLEKEPMLTKAVV